MSGEADEIVELERTFVPPSTDVAAATAG